MTTDDRTETDALLPAEREMSAAQWAEYGGLPTALRSYCHLLMKREADARLRERQAEMEAAEWRERTARLLTRAEAAEAALAAARAEVAQARADRTLLTGLWLATAPPDVLPALLPTDPGDLERLAAALEAVDLQSGTESHTAAVRAIIARIAAETAGGAR